MRILSQHPDFEIICRDNVPTAPLRQACEKYGVHYVANKKERGFATNNNLNFKYCKEQLKMEPNDYFLLLNPDVYMLSKDVNKLVNELKKQLHQVYVPNLQLDKEGFMQDDNIRHFPKFGHFLQTYLLNRRVTMIDRRNGLDDTFNLWASGAFVVIRSQLYEQVKGLDERYYLYCEDIDMFARLRRNGVRFHYLHDIQPVHFRRRKSRNLASKHFYWHVSSVLKHTILPKQVQSKRSVLHGDEPRNNSNNKPLRLKRFRRNRAHWFGIGLLQRWGIYRAANTLYSSLQRLSATHCPLYCGWWWLNRQYANYRL